MQVAAPSNYEEKLKVLNEMKEKFYKLSEEYKEAHAEIKRGVETRDLKSNALQEEMNTVNAEMAKLNKFGKEVEEEMKTAMVTYDQGVELMKDLSSNDLIALISLKKPDNEVVAVMNAVSAILGKSRGWENAVKHVTTKDFMFNIGEVDYEKLPYETVEAAREFQKQYNSESVLRKEKSAGAFGTWIDGICLVREIIDDKMVDLQEMQAKAKENAEAYNVNKEKLLEFQDQLKRQGETINAKSAEILALKDQMAKIGKLQFGDWKNFYGDQ